MFIFLTLKIARDFLGVFLGKCDFKMMYMLTEERIRESQEGQRTRQGGRLRRKSSNFLLDNKKQRLVKNTVEAIAF